MSEEELIETLRAFEKNRVEQLEEPAKNLFYAIMKIADERDRLNKELKIYKLRHKLALKKLNSAIRHYDNDKENNAIIYTKQILEGQGIEEKCQNMLRGDKE